MLSLQAGTKTVPTVEEGEAESTKCKKRIDFIKWIVAFQNLSLAADAVGVWKHFASSAHLRICLQVAGGFFCFVHVVSFLLAFCCCTAGASLEKRRFCLAQIYDEICRAEWGERAARGDADFDVNVSSLTCCPELLARARLAHDAAMLRAPRPVATPQPQSVDQGARSSFQPKGKGKGKKPQWQKTSGWDRNWGKQQKRSWWGMWHDCACDKFVSFTVCR